MQYSTTQLEKLKKELDRKCRSRTIERRAVSVSIREITERIDKWWADERNRETESISDYKSDV